MALTATAPTGGDDILSDWGTAVVADLAFVYANASPIGSITMWAGADNALPTNWKLCNGDELDQTTFAALYAVIGDTFNNSPAVGSFNLPDMRDRFVVGAGSDYSRNAKGGSSSNTLTHSGTAASFNKTSLNTNQTAHSHTYGTLYAQLNVSNSSALFWVNRISTETWSYDTQATYSVRSGVSGSTTIGTGIGGATGSGTIAWSSSTVSCSMTQPSSHSSIENRPPYIGMFYIIKYQ